MNLALIFAVNFVEQLKAQKMFAERDFIAVLKRFLNDFLPVDQRSAAGMQIGQDVFGRSGFGIDNRFKTGVAARNCITALRASLPIFFSIACAVCRST